MKTVFSLFGIAVILLVSACGQKGDLYRTENVPPPEMEQPAEK